MKKIIVITIISMLTAVMLVGCKSKELTETQPVSQPVSSAKLMAPTVVGKVLEVKEDSTAILVDSTAETVKGQIWVSIDSKTNFFENVTVGTSIPYQNVSRKFVVANHVEIFIEGGIKESSPMQATATSVYVNEAKK